MVPLPYIRTFRLEQIKDCLLNHSHNTVKSFKNATFVLKLLKKMCLTKNVYSSVQSTYLAWWEDREEGQVGMSHCTQTEHSQLLELSQDATLKKLTGL